MTRRIAVLIFDGVQSLDVSGPVEVFSLADRAAGGDAYELRILAPGAAPVRASSGLRLLPDGAIADEPPTALDTLLVAGGTGVRAAAGDERVIEWVIAASARARRTASVCTGAFLLARAGLLDGRRATTHWAACSALQREHPAVEVDPAPIFVSDGGVFTSAGVTAGIDLALALVEQDLGHQVALSVARALVLFVRRPGGQAQFGAALSAQAAREPRVRILQQWIAANLESDLSVAALAERCYMSPRHFARVFAKETGATPADYVEVQRLERARVLLETSDQQLQAIARACGFGTVETLRRTFARRLGVSPSEYRARFGVRDDNVIPIRRAAG